MMKYQIVDSLKHAGTGVAGVAGIEGVNDIPTGSPLIDTILKVVILVVTVGKSVEPLIRGIIGIFKKKKA